ncbi:hypothetical protein ACFZC5_36035 [Nocardia gamkensis]|uniref:hypothetical protein n=1 Tax=Nocardia gamkensis TaxID=352869 RepID=UPI0036E7D44C
MPRPNRRLCRSQGKTGTVDAYAAARRLLDGSGVTAPKLRNSAIEAVRALHVARHGAVKAATAALNALRGLVTTSPGGVARPVAGETGGHLRRVPSRPCASHRSGAGDQAGASFARRSGSGSADQANQLECHLHKVLEQVAPKTFRYSLWGQIRPRRW